jgi:hypothetical protein
MSNRKHAFLSASGSPSWMLCEIKPLREEGLPETSNSFAEEGTSAHELLEYCLTHGYEDALDVSVPRDKVEIWTPEMANYVNQTLDLIRSLKEPDGYLYSEEELDISFITGEVEATGTADIVIVNVTELVVLDFKYGMSLISATENEQLLIYGAAALEKYNLTGDIKNVRFIISQPRLNHIEEWVLSIPEIEDRIRRIREVATRILAAKGGVDNLHASPGYKQCRYCKYKANCPDNRGFVLTAVTNDIVDLDKKEEFLEKVKNSTLKLETSDDHHLATCLTAVELIEDWCSTVRIEVEKRLLDNNFKDDRWKLVRGRRGNLKWVEDDKVIHILEELYGADTIYEKKIINPTQLEKKVVELGLEVIDFTGITTRSQGKLVIAPKTDKRPNIFEALTFDPIEEEFVDALVGLSRR